MKFEFEQGDDQKNFEKKLQCFFNKKSSKNKINQCLLGESIGS